MLFRDQTEIGILEGIRRIQHDQAMARDEHLDKLDDYYAGGENVAKYLTQHESEEPEDYQRRKDNLSNANYVGLFANKLIDSVFTGEVYRSFEDASDDQNDILSGIFGTAEMEEVDSEIGQGCVVHGDGWGMVDVDEDDKQIVVHPVHCSNVWPEYNPRNRTKIRALIERRYLERRDGQDIYEYLAWGMEGDQGPWSQLFDNSGHPKEERKPNRLGIIPYARYKGRSVIGMAEGVSYIEDAITLQRDLLDLASELGLLVRYQTGALLLIKDDELPEVGAGPRAALRIGKDADAQFLQPGAAVLDVLELMREKVSQMFETAGVPVEIAQRSGPRGWSGAQGDGSSGYALEIRFRPFTRLTGKMQRKRAIGDKRLVRIVTQAYNVYVRPGTFPELANVLPVVEYRTEVVPRDTERELDTDLKLVSGRPQLMTRQTFLKRHMERYSLKSDQDVTEYLQLLDAEEQAAASLEGTRLGGGAFGAPLPGLVGLEA